MARHCRSILEEAVNETDLVGEEKSEAYADHPGRCRKWRCKNEKRAQAEKHGGGLHTASVIGRMVADKECEPAN